MREIYLKIMILTTVFTGLTALSTASYTNDIKWDQPFNPEASDMPLHFDSGSNNIDFQIVVNDFTNNIQNASLYRKKTSESSFSKVESTVVKDDWGHGQSSGNEDISADEINFPGESSTLTVSEGGSQTVTIDGTEHTIETVNVYDSNSPPSADIRIDGVLYDPLYTGEGIYVDGKYIRIRGVLTTSVYFQLEDKSINLNDGNYEYRAKYNGGLTEEIVFDVNPNDGFNVPYLKNVSVEGNRLFDFTTGTVSTGSSIEAVVKQNEGDSFNVTLVDDSTGSEVLEYQFNGSGGLTSAYNSILEGTLGVFTDVSGFQNSDLAKVSFSVPQGSDLLSTDASNYDFSIDVEDLGSSITRNGVTYNVDTSGVNDAPSIDRVQGFDGVSWKNITEFTGSFESLTEIRVKASDNNNDQLYASLNLTQLYDNQERQVETSSGFNYDERVVASSNSEYYVWDVSDNSFPTTEINESGSWRVEAFVSDGSKNDSVTREWSVPFGDVNFELLNPITDINIFQNETFEFKYRVTCSGGPECVNQNESLNVWPDPVQAGGLS